MKGQKRRHRLGTLLFFIPVLLVLALVAYAIIDTSGLRNGTLVVKAQTSTRYYPAEYLNVSVSVAGRSGITPFTLSLPQGTYIVSFPAQRWFSSPPSRTVNVTGGGTSYVVGVYDPIPVLVSVSQSGFNVTSVTVLHKATPLTWVNPSPSYEVLTSSLTGRIIVAPLQNYTYVFQSIGTFAFSIFGASSPELIVTSV